MPKLSDPKITKGYAVSVLIGLYLQESEFCNELCQVREKHNELLLEFVSRQIEFLVYCVTTMTPQEYHKIHCDLRAFLTQPSASHAFTSNLTHRLEGMKDMCVQLRPYFTDLEQLAYRWKLRAPWAGPMLHLDYLHDRLKGLGMPDAADLASEQLELLYPWPPPIPSLEIKVPAWALVFSDRRGIQIDIAQKLKDYENQLRALGLREYPSSLERHARWWFERFVHGKRYDDIAQEEAYTPGGSVASYARNVGTAVRTFSRLIGIDTKNLK